MFGSIAFLNLWAYFLVNIVARRGGDIGIVKITDDDIVRFMSLSGLFGAWAAIICTFIDSLGCLADDRKGCIRK
jgi:hypothetical protein